MILQGRWKMDDPDDLDDRPTFEKAFGATEESSSILTVRTKARGGGSPSNFMYELATSSKRYFFEVQVLKKDRGSSLSVGVVSPSKFRAGYGMKAMLYNGNLTNGSAALKTGHGPYVKEGDVIVVEFAENEDNLEVIYHVNGDCIGTGFQVTKEDTPFFPCLAAKGEVQVNVKTMLVAPESLATEPSTAIGSFGGRYEVTQAMDPGSGEEFIPVIAGASRGGEVRTPIELSISHDHGDMWNLTAKVCNTLSIRKRITTAKTATEFILGDIGHGAFSTRMMPHPIDDQVERKLTSCLNDAWASMKLSQNRKTLTIFNIDKKLVLTGIRHEPKQDHPPCTSYD